jgi:hypothetical protein
MRWSYARGKTRAWLRTAVDLPIKHFVSRKQQNPPPQPDDSEQRKFQIYVRRGALRRVDRLKKGTGQLPIELKWDRRQAEAPASLDGVTPRGKDRRKEPPFTWGSADFVVVVESYDEE